MTTGQGGASARDSLEGKVVVGGTNIARVTSHSVNATSSSTVWGDSDSEGYTNRKKGRKDATINFEGKFDEDTPVYDLFAEGDIVKLVLWESTSQSDYWVFPCALIESFTINVNQDTNEVIGWSATAGADGKYWRPNQSGAPAETPPS